MAGTNPYEVLLESKDLYEEMLKLLQKYVDANSHSKGDPTKWVLAAFTAAGRLLEQCKEGCQHMGVPPAMLYSCISMVQGLEPDPACRGLYERGKKNVDLTKLSKKHYMQEKEEDNSISVDHLPDCGNPNCPVHGNKEGDMKN